MHRNEKEVRHLLILVDDMVRDGRSEEEIEAAVRRAEREGAIVLHGRRPRLR